MMAMHLAYSTNSNLSFPPTESNARTGTVNIIAENILNGSRSLIGNYPRNKGIDLAKSHNDKINAWDEEIYEVHDEKGRKLIIDD